jgi:hypothetical protein
MVLLFLTASSDIGGWEGVDWEHGLWMSFQIGTARTLMGDDICLGNQCRVDYHKRQSCFVIEWSSKKNHDSVSI